MLATAPVSTEDLLTLWHGDEHTTGYWHPELVVAVCDLTQPVDATAVRNRFYPARVAKELPDGASDMIVHGYWIWRKRQP